MIGSRPRLAVLGSLTLDEIGDGNSRRVALGGSAWYVSMTSALLGCEVDVISRVGTDYPQGGLARMKKSGVDVGHVRRMLGETCRFELEYVKGVRTMRLRKLGPRLTSADLDGHWKGLHIGPVFDEIPPALIRNCRGSSEIVSMDLQGFVRAKDSRGRIFLKPAELGGMLRYVDLLKASSEEALMQTNSSRLVSAISRILRGGPRWLLVTLGEKGSVLAEIGGGMARIPAYPEAEVVDPTGAGDALVGGWLSAYSATKDHLWALSIGAAVASLVVRRFGLSKFNWSNAELLRRAVWVHSRIRPYA